MNRHFLYPLRERIRDFSSQRIMVICPVPRRTGRGRAGRRAWASESSMVLVRVVRFGFRNLDIFIFRTKPAIRCGGIPHPRGNHSLSRPRQCPIRGRPNGWSCRVGRYRGSNVDELMSRIHTRKHSGGGLCRVCFPAVVLCNRQPSPPRRCPPVCPGLRSHQPTSH